MGKNGEGKSTLIKLVVGDVEASNGIIELGHNVFLGYYAQNQAEALDPKITVLETMEKNSPYELRPRLRNILGSFLFRGEDVDKKVSVLSGGERARLAMAAMLLHPINLLVMDEPTNHLDMLSKAILKQALLEFDGTLLVVSHDRDFLDGMTDKVIEFSNKKIITYLGDLQYFLEKRQYGNLRDVSLGKSGLKSLSSNNQSKNETSIDESQEIVKKLKKEIQNIEKNINRIEEDQKKLEKILGDADKFGTKDYQSAIEKYEQNKKELNKTMADWEKHEMELDSHSK
jgi:ATP-binding cassette subfamily F protein 3